MTSTSRPEATQASALSSDFGDTPQEGLHTCDTRWPSRTALPTLATRLRRVWVPSSRPDLSGSQRGAGAPATPLAKLWASVAPAEVRVGSRGCHRYYTNMIKQLNISSTLLMSWNRFERSQTQI